MRWLALLAVLAAPPAVARPQRVDQIPNGGVLGCRSCHLSSTRLARNAFGLDVETTLRGNAADWSRLFNLDSDGDGFSNGQELGDPCGDWSAGRTPARSAEISNPSDRGSVPPSPPGPVCRCGNGVIDPGEGCDDGNLVHRDRCTNDCTPTTCGDARVDPGELCDDGNDDDADACRTSCVPARCGDGVVQRGVERCDDGNLVDGDACSNRCEPTACGDGVRQPGEACDDGAANDDQRPDACRTTCTLARCGDAVTDRGEACDDGPDNGVGGRCTTTCAVPRCGDGTIDPGELCDDGALNDDRAANACRTTCRPAGCGDRVVDRGEVCDDGPSGSERCTPECTTPLPSASPTGCASGAAAWWIALLALRRRREDGWGRLCRTGTRKTGTRKTRTRQTG